MQFNSKDINLNQSRKFRVLVNNMPLVFNGANVFYNADSSKDSGLGTLRSKNEFTTDDTGISRVITEHLNNDFGTGFTDLLDKFGYEISVDSDSYMINICSKLFLTFIEVIYKGDGPILNDVRISDKIIPANIAHQFSGFLSDYMLNCYARSMRTFSESKRFRNDNSLYRFFILPVYNLFSVFTENSNAVICPFLTDRRFSSLRDSAIFQVASEHSHSVRGFKIMLVPMNKACKSLNMQPFRIGTPVLFSLIAGFVSDSYPNSRIKKLYDGEGNIVESNESGDSKVRELSTLYALTRAYPKESHTVYTNLLQAKLLMKGDVDFA